ncbi:MAG TPA: type II secretion system protein GspL [bacterium]|nr:type II secretion system protein GspL [bacterium]
MPQVVGLDIGSRSVKAALFERGFRGLELSSFHKADFDPADPEGVGKALADIASQLTGAPTVVARLPGDRVLLRFLDMPMSDARKLDQVIPFEVESQVPYELEELVLDHTTVRRSPEGGAKVLVAAARREDVKAAIEQLTAGGMEPRWVVAGPAALASLAVAVPALAKGVVALVDGGYTRTDVCILRDGKPAFVRTISGGVADIADAHLAGGGPLESLESIDVTAGAPEAAAMRAASEFVARELRRTMLSAEIEAQLVPEKIVFFGGLSRLRGLSALVERTVQIPVEPLVLAGAEWAKVPLTGGAEAEAGTAVALAFRAVSDSVVPNFRRDEFAWKRDAKELSGVIARLAAAAMVLLFLAFANYVVKERLLASEKKAMDKEIAAEVLAAFPDAPKDRLKDGDAAVSIMRGNVDDAETRLAQLGGGSNASVLDILKAVSEAAPAGMYIDVKDFDYSENKVRLKVVLDSYQDSDKLQAALKKVKMFQNIDANDDGNDVGTGKRRITVKFDVNPAAANEEA